MLVVRRFYIAISVFGALVGVAVEAEMPEPDFAREVLPILSEKCFVCHGPDAKKDERKLTHYEEAVRLRKGKQASIRSWRTVFCSPASRTKKIRCPVDEKPLTESEREIWRAGPLGREIRQALGIRAPRRDARYNRSMIS